MDDASSRKFFGDLSLWIVVLLRVLTGIKVIEDSIELVETVCCGQELVTITEVILPKLTGRITKRLKQLREAWVFLL
jgi:hypothetical protein